MSSTVQICNMALSHIGAGVDQRDKPARRQHRGRLLRGVLRPGRIELPEGSNWDLR